MSSFSLRFDSPTLSSFSAAGLSLANIARCLASAAVSSPFSANKRVGYEESAKVPWLLRWPAQLPSGLVYEGGVMTLDIMPTMLEAAGLPVPMRVEGISRLANIRLKRTGWTDPVFQQNVTQPRIASGPHDERMVRQREWKLILRKFRAEPPPELRTHTAELYNLSNTPVFRTPENDVNEGSFGEIERTRGGPRVIQLGLKLRF